MGKVKVGVFVGSLRKGSYAKAIAVWLKENSPENLELELVEIGQLPFYNQDFDSDSPASFTAFREKVKTFGAFLFVTPEYNRSVPAVLKNALDVASRPWGQSVWGGKPGGVISHSIGDIGGFGANHHLRQILAFLDIYTMQQPECYVGKSGSSISEDGVVDDHLAKYLGSYLKAYAAWVERFV